MGERSPSPKVIANLPVSDSETLRVAIADRHGTLILDLRIYSLLTTISGIETSTGRGFAVPADVLSDLIEALQEAERTARSRGLIGGENV